MQNETKSYEMRSNAQWDMSLSQPNLCRVVYNLRGGFLGSVTPAMEQKDFRTKVHLYQDVWTPKEFVPEWVQLT